MNEENFKLLDASYEPESNLMDPVTYQQLYYAKWDKLMEEKVNFLILAIGLRQKSLFKKH